MDEIQKITRTHVEKFWAMRDEYDRSFNRYIIVGSGASVGLILSFLGNNKSAFTGLLSFDTAVWCFVFAILLGGVCTFLTARLAHKYTKHFAKLLGFIAGYQFAEGDEIPDEFGEIAKSKKLDILHGVLIVTQTVAAASFAIGLILSTYMATQIL